MKKNQLKTQVTVAINACNEKKAEELTILEIDKNSGAFTDYFIICSGTNPRQIQAISDEVELRLKRAGVYPNSIEGYKQAEWVLIDYVDFVVHVFSESARKYYDLERLWRSAKKIEPTGFTAKPRRTIARKQVRKRA
jgi:ribosome-associated protein